MINLKVTSNENKSSRELRVGSSTKGFFFICSLRLSWTFSQMHWEYVRDGIFCLSLEWEFTIALSLKFDLIKIYWEHASVDENTSSECMEERPRLFNGFGYCSYWPESFSKTFQIEYLWSLACCRIHVTASNVLYICYHAWALKGNSNLFILVDYKRQISIFLVRKKREQGANHS